MSFSSYLYSAKPNKVGTEIFSSMDNFQSEDNQTIAKRLGIDNHDELHVDRFQVDRRKLHKMNKSCVQGPCEAESYFDGIMKTTETYISWPRQLTTKSKKDPYIAVYGRTNDIDWAKGLILTVLHTKGVLLRLKLALSHTDHSFLAGNGSSIAKEIMAKTDTFIQFPDTSQGNMQKKNHQASMYGCLEDLKQALELLRASVPLLVSFELLPGQRTPPIRRVQDEFNVRVILSPNSKSNTSVILVKGTLDQAAKVMEATKKLTQSVDRQYAMKTLVSLQLDIPPPYHDTVKGHDSVNILTTMENTRTKILFPDLSMRGTIKQKSRVTITGSVDGVHKARQELMGYLPIELTFDVPAEKQNYATEMMNLGTQFGVLMTLSQKEWSNALAVTIKASENSIDKIYQVQQDILQLSLDPPIEVGIPKAFSNFDGIYQGKSIVGNVVEPLSNSYAEFQPISSDLSNVDQLSYIQTGQGDYQSRHSPDSGNGSDNIQQIQYQTNDWTDIDGFSHNAQSFNGQYVVPQDQIQFNDLIEHRMYSLNLNNRFENQYVVHPDESHSDVIHRNFNQSFDDQYILHPEESQSDQYIAHHNSDQTFVAQYHPQESYLNTGLQRLDVDAQGIWENYPNTQIDSGHGQYYFGGNVADAAVLFRSS